MSDARRPWWEDPGIAAWEPSSTPHVNLGSSYPTRVDTSENNPDQQPRPAGFTAKVGTTKLATAPDDDVIEAEILCDHPGEEIPAHAWDPDNGCPYLEDAVTSDRCPECGDADGLHFRCCTSYREKDPWL